MKKGQVSLIAILYLVAAIVMFFPFLHIYSEMSPVLLESIENVFVRFLVYAIPVFYWVGAIFLFLNVLKGGQAVS